MNRDNLQVTDRMINRQGRQTGREMGEFQARLGSFHYWVYAFVQYGTALNGQWIAMVEL